jgi:hypothetical protein
LLRRPGSAPRRLHVAGTVFLPMRGGGRTATRDCDDVCTQVTYLGAGVLRTVDVCVVLGAVALPLA